MVRAFVAPSLVVLVALSSLACDKDKDKPSSTTTSASQPSSVASPTMPTAASDAAVESPTAVTTKAAAAKKEPVVTFKDGLATPESVLYDETNDLYLVSNINGKPLDVDGNGFISKLSPDGKVAALKWIEGGKNKVTLNAPKGMAFVGDLLYVADLDTVRMFERKTGAPAGEVKVPGATFLNDIAVTADGRVLVSDMGMKAGGKGFEPSGTDAVYAIDKAKKLTTIAKATELGAPNGLLSVGDKTWVATFGVGRALRARCEGQEDRSAEAPQGNARRHRPAPRRRSPRLELGGERRLPRQAGRRLHSRDREREVARRYRLRHEALARPRPALREQRSAGLRGQVISRPR